ncbi:MAG: hypothetical protein DVB31_05970 [Verrucomicrobia bacterium]|nr:MAG: hypothetical protein DVB31_05970 [Verrucomicrobiota bacterium]
MLIPQRAGVMILESACLLPHALLPLFIFEPRYRAMLAGALESHRMFCVALQKPGSSRESPLPVATLGLVRASVRNPDGTSNLVLQGVARVRLGRANQLEPYRVHPLAPVVPAAESTPKVDALRSRVIDLVDYRLRQGSAIHPEMVRQIADATGNPSATVDDCLRVLRDMPDPGKMADFVALLLLKDPSARFAIQQSVGIEERLRNLVGFLLPGNSGTTAG